MTTPARALLLLLAMLTLALVPGCNGGAIASGLPQDKPVDQLTPAEVDQLCHSVDDYLFRVYPVSEEHRVSCTGTALSRTPTQSACLEDVRACMMSAFPGRAHLDCSSATTTGCTATVDQIETCIEDRARAFDQRAGEVQCSLAGNTSEILRLVSTIPLPASCTSLSAICRTEIGI